MSKNIRCRFCDSDINRNTIGLNKKIFGEDQRKDRMMCIACMAGVLECSEEDLIEKINEFKNEGCPLFE